MSKHYLILLSVLAIFIATYKPNNLVKAQTKKCTKFATIKTKIGKDSVAVMFGKYDSTINGKVVKVLWDEELKIHRFIVTLQTNVD
jgi:hypothetical protein